jgi:hypothetical protein
MLSWAPKPAKPGRIQKGRVNIPKTDGNALARPKIAAVITAPIPQNSRTLLMVDEDMLLDYTLRRSFHPPLFVGFPEGYKIIYVPEPIWSRQGHRWRRAKCTMNFNEVVREII